MEDKLINCPLFSGISADIISFLFQKIEYQLLDYRKNDVIVMENDLCNRLLIVLKGTVRGEMTDFMGKIIKIEDIDTFRPLAPAFLFGLQNRYPVSIIANEDAEILSVSQAMTLQLFQLNQRFLVNFLNMISNRAQFLSQKIKFLSFQTIKGKIAHYLLQINKEKKSVMITLPASQKEISEYFGVTRPSLARAIGELARDGYIEAKGKNIKILNHDKLAMLLR
jgi:CRP-like cAMP-binding protein